MAAVPGSAVRCNHGESEQECINVDSLQSHRMSSPVEPSRQPLAGGIRSARGGERRPDRDHRRADLERRVRAQPEACARAWFVRIARLGARPAWRRGRPALTGRASAGLARRLGAAGAAVGRPTRAVKTRQSARSPGCAVMLTSQQGRAAAQSPAHRLSVVHWGQPRPPRSHARTYCFDVTSHHAATVAWMVCIALLKRL